jgi:hypothetical protein
VDKLYLDDRLYPVHQGPVIRGSYRGRRMKQFNPQRPGACSTKKLVSTANGWHRIVCYENGIETYRTPPTRDRAAALSLLQPIG